MNYLKRPLKKLKTLLNFLSKSAFNQKRTKSNSSYIDLAQMAADPDIQRELIAINAEFVVTEMDGLVNSLPNADTSH